MSLVSFRGRPFCDFGGFRRFDFGGGMGYNDLTCIEDSTWQCELGITMKIKRRSSTLHRVRRSGFRARMKTRSGRAMINARRRRGSKRLAPSRTQ